MPRKSVPPGRTRNLSISLPRELAEAVSSRVDSAWYSSASEVIREALRLLFRVEEGQRTYGTDVDGPVERFERAMELHDLASGMRKVRSSEEEERRTRWRNEQEVGPGLRIDEERLERLRIRE